GDDDQLCNSLDTIDETRNSPTRAAHLATPYQVRTADQSGLNYEKIIGYHLIIGHELLFVKFYRIFDSSPIGCKILA
ncbi:MAG: hypothetical protein MHMPM18_001849, partial [Marteilia pararefringens]